MKQWFELGRLLGYPQCCIETFVVRATKLDLTIGTPLGNTGYIMCDVCKEKSYTEVVALIDKQRHPQLPPFPTVSMSFKKLKELML